MLISFGSVQTEECYGLYKNDQFQALVSRQTMGWGLRKSCFWPWNTEKCAISMLKTTDKWFLKQLQPKSPNQHFYTPCSKFLVTAKVGLAHYDPFCGGEAQMWCVNETIQVEYGSAVLEWYFCNPKDISAVLLTASKNLYVGMHSEVYEMTWFKCGLMTDTVELYILILV